MMDLQLADKVEIVILSDNHSDVLLPGNKSVERPTLAKDGVIPTNTLLAEHGLSLLVTVWMNEKPHSIVLDSGYTNVAVPHNLDYLGIDLEEIEAVILSHGHMDHTGALKEILKRAAKGVQVVLHPDVFDPRSLENPAGETIYFPAFPSREQLADWGAELVENKEPLLLAGNGILVTGEVPRLTPFEKGIPGAMAKHDHVFVKDTFNDDQSLVIHIKNKGLVVISGCAHSGIINSIQQARQLTGQDTVCAVIGGFHLSGAAMEPSVEPTIEALKQMPLQLICPMHCTGFKAISTLARELSDVFVLSSVGSKITL